MARIAHEIHHVLPNNHVLGAVGERNCIASLPNETGRNSLGIEYASGLTNSDSFWTDASGKELQKMGSWLARLEAIWRP
jgi:hypothetical protein